MNGEKENKVVLYIAMSLDGYIAREDDSVDWLNDVKGDGGDNGFADFYKTVGALITGSKTYDVVLTLTDEFPYEGKPCYVTTRTPNKFQPKPHVIFTDEPLSVLMPRIKAQTKGDVWLVGGGLLAKDFMKEGLLDEAVIAVIPKVLGGGIPLFPEGVRPAAFELRHMESLGDIARLHYTVLK